MLRKYTVYVSTAFTFFESTIACRKSVAALMQNNSCQSWNHLGLVILVELNKQVLALFSVNVCGRNECIT